MKKNILFSRLGKRKSLGYLVYYLIFQITIGTAFFATPVEATTGVPQILAYQGRLTDSSGALLGTASGTTYFFKFSIWDTSSTSTGSRLWPSSAPASTSVTVISGVFNVNIGDTGAGYPDALTYNFQDNANVFLQLEVSATANGTYEALGPRQRITSAGFAINAGTVLGFTPSQTPSGSNIPVLSSGNLLLSGTNPQFNATSTNTLTLQGGTGTGDIQFFSSANKITSAGNLTIASILTAPSIAFTNATGTGNFQVATFTTTGTSTLAITGGNVGIGTSTTPTAKLTLAGGNFLHYAAGNPTLKGTYDTTGLAFDVYVSGKYAYIADGASGLQIIDITNPASPALTSTYDTPGTALDLYISDKYAYVVDAGSGIQIIDITNPAVPTLTGNYAGSTGSNGIYVSGKYAYVGNGSAGLDIIDISNPAAPTLAGNYNTTRFTSEVYVSGKYAYLSEDLSGSGRLDIVDISNPVAPTLTGFATTTGGVYGVYVSGRYAYIGDQGSGFKIFDVSNPATPTLVGTLALSGLAKVVYVSGKYAYAAGGTSGLHVIDISNPAAPALVGTYDSPGTALSVVVSGKYAYVADQGSGLAIVDISGIETPSLYAGNIQTNDITVTENADIGNNLYARNGINVGTGGIFSNGTIVGTNLQSIATSTLGGNTIIGSTSTPSSTLHVIGTATISATTTIQGRLVDAGGNAYVTSTGSGTVTTSSAVTVNYFPFWQSASGLSGTSTLYASSSRIGIGTISPSTTLHIVGDLKVTATTTVLGNLQDASGNNYVTSTTAGSGTVTTSTAVTAGYFPFWGSASALTGTSTIFSSSSLIGIGTISPSSTLHVVGTFQTTATSTLLGNTIIGSTSTPSSTLHVVGSFTVTATTSLQGQSTIDNAILGATSFEADAGTVSWMDMPVSTVAATNTVESYSAQIDGTPLLTVYAQANGSGGIQKQGVLIATSTQSATSSIFYIATSTPILQVRPSGGIVVGAPTGDDKGYGTINAQAVYDDNTLLTDWVFDAHYDTMNASDTELHADYKMMTIDEMMAYNKENRHLPTITGRQDWNKKGGLSLGALSSQLWETIETQALYIGELNSRLLALETASSTALQGNVNGSQQLPVSDLTVTQLTINNNLVVKGTTTFSADTVGQAKMLPGATTVHVGFASTYTTTPIVTITPQGQSGLGDFRFAVTNVGAGGFDIAITSGQSEAVLFNWHAFGSADDAKIFVSDGSTEAITLTVIGAPPAPPPAGGEPINTGGEVAGDATSTSDQPLVETPPIENATTSTTTPSAAADQTVPPADSSSTPPAVTDGSNTSAFIPAGDLVAAAGGSSL